MGKRFVVAGPAKVGNCFGFFGHTLPEGKFAVCSSGEYANGGRGPSQSVQRLFDSEEAALAWIAGEAEQDEYYGTSDEDGPAR